MFYLNIKSSQYKFKNDLRWNFFSFIVIAIAGLLINILITRFYGFAILGFFNLLFVFFLVLSQISSWGIHLSVQKFVPQFSGSLVLSKQHLTSTSLLSLIFSIGVVLVLILLSDLPGRILGNKLLEEAFPYSTYGIVFISINKVFLSFFNGMRFMKSYALYNSLRSVFMLAFLFVFIAMKPDLEYLGLIFTIPELVLSLLLIFKLRSWFIQMSVRRLKRLIRLHLSYGSRVALGNIVISLNSKIDILILGIYVTEALVGVYSFAVFIVDGFSQLFQVFRNNINPIITETFYNRNRGLLRRLIDNWREKFYKFFIAVGLLAGMIYPLFLLMVNVESYYWENLIIFYGLIIGILISSGYMPFQFVFNQIGKSREHTRFLSILFVLNIVLNLIFVSILGVYGAVGAVVLLNVFQLLYLRQGLRNI